ncbi:N-6 DNA methylase [Nitritalea halalkaliphila LW7]|uniref:N-6 DNA methylase n=1 Tax=Nitritalea halalkaliphila LW7 TaxID=1189621 RepID=I5C9P3_9BACT|nr:N-6 DNA methylase [Nitritalea halalkaliphila LW7]
MLEPTKQKVLDYYPKVKALKEGAKDLAWNKIAGFNFHNRSQENIPFLKKDEDGKLVPQTIEEYFETEVLPHFPEGWVDENKTKIGYEINFTKYFYEFKPLRPLAEIKADILAFEEKVLKTEKKVLE